jgi:prolyl-tRNA synthetase
MLPLGYRVQEKVERLIDRHMYSLGIVERAHEFRLRS